MYSDETVPPLSKIADLVNFGQYPEFSRWIHASGQIYSFRTRYRKMTLAMCYPIISKARLAMRLLGPVGMEYHITQIGFKLNASV